MTSDDRAEVSAQERGRGPHSVVNHNEQSGKAEPGQRARTLGERLGVIVLRDEGLMWLDHGCGRELRT
jgi:hypothetical protein